MGTMSAQGTLPVSGASIAAEPITNTFNHIMTTYNGGNITTSNVDLTAIASLTTAQAISGVKTYSGLNVYTADQTFNDSVKLTLGTGGDADIFYDGTDLNISPAIVGAGDIVVNGASIEFADNEGVTLGTGKDATIKFDATNTVVATAAQLVLTPTTDTIFSNGTGVVVGHTAQMTAGGVAQEMQVLGTGAADSQMVLGRFSADAAGPILTFAKSRDPAIFDGSFAIVADDDTIGAIYATVDDGTDFAQIAASINFVVDDGTPAANATGGSIEFHTVNASGSGAERMRINEAGDVHVANDVVLGATSEMFFGDTANAEVTTGLTINQGAADDFVIALKSSDVAHGITDKAETDTYGSIQKNGAATGGLFVKGYTEGTQSFGVLAYYTTDNTTHTASGDAPIALWSHKKDGTGSGSPGANGNVMVVGDYTNGASFIVDKEGDLFANGSATTVYDDRDDMALLSAFDRDIKGFIEQDWEKNLRENEKTLIDIGILGGPRVDVPAKERGLINYTGLARLHNSALRQVYTKLVETVERLTVAESKLKMLEA